MSPVVTAAWFAVVIGALLVISGIDAVLYFREHNNALKNNWVMRAVYRTVVTITVVVAIWTVGRAYVLWAGGDQPPWISLINGIAAIWLALIPRFLISEFRSHHGLGDTGRS